MVGDDASPSAGPVASAEAEEEPSQSAAELAAEREAAEEAEAAEREAAEAAAQERREARQAAAEARQKAKRARQRAAREEAARLNPATYRTLTARDYALIVKNPDAHIGKKIVIHGWVTQSDSVTGPEALLADTAATQGYEWYDFGTNALISAPGPGLFKRVVEDDLVTMYVEVVGSYSYDTQAGGNTTVPHFLANIIRITGSV